MSALIEHGLKAKTVSPVKSKPDAAATRKMTRPMGNIWVKMHDVQAQAAHEHLSGRTLSGAACPAVDDNEETG